jgi:HlyD family secretion protein
MFAWLCSFAWIATLLGGCPAGANGLVFNGYVEGEYVLIAPRETGRILALEVERGQEVAAGELLLRMEDDEERDAVAMAAAEVTAAEAELADLEQGKRPEEIAVTEAELAEALAQLQDARQELERMQALFDRRAIAAAALDEARALHDAAEARVEAIRRRMTVDSLAAREQVLAAAAARIAASRAALSQAEWRLAQVAVRAPVAGIIDDVLRRQGEIAGPDRPALSLLPPAGRIVRFFVPQAVRAGIRPGNAVSITCDGCPVPLPGRVTFVSSQAEFTPPVIYSIESREKLVFLIEARPEDGALLPGQPVDVTLVEEPAP